MKRREFVKKTTQASVALSTIGLAACNTSTKNKPDIVVKEIPLFFKISLAQWSLNRALKSNKIDNLDFAGISAELGCEGVEYVNGFFMDKAKDMDYLKQMNTRAADAGQKNVLIMIDSEGALAHFDSKERKIAIENHYKWVEAAHFLDCHAIRVNLAGGKVAEDAVKASLDSLNRLSDFAAGSNMNILVENHGGFSSSGAWMADVFSQVKHKNCGTLPDFGNFCVEYNDTGCTEEYDRYLGMKELLPYAKAISAKSYDFDVNGNETTIDYYKVMKMVKDSGYTGYIGIEFEGGNISEMKGIELTRNLLKKVGKQLTVNN